MDDAHASLRATGGYDKAADERESQKMSSGDGARQTTQHIPRAPVHHGSWHALEAELVDHR